ncbi:hypothetical protein CHGG_00382 [Chaetomium globosum CBS 148.51]|uniref:NYN domain-containing protein n=1 Tax=Chaetomium globosum (strain ATCC 6205 / CBS 148.51 / DSM 1962 / NBRC 6347 / NRRL 1970) TaxID=306901 RepID=Q2HHC2_CHAGB|nr:uncharacterized protein CHGG_00382 [Chaetomium globosum CBS 148.51]EAQ92147.1 hypothetical protein CHGG_00382 [Chaetomium globosum CBS 148.51]
MASKTYFGRAEHEGRRLGADFDLLAKWSRACSLDHPIHSYYLTQLSHEDRSQLFAGPVQEFRLEKGPNDTVKLETIQDEVDRLDPDVIEMMRSPNYQRSEARRFEMLNEIEDIHDKADGAAALALSSALLRGMDGPPAERLAKRVSDRILDSAGAKVMARWKAARDGRLMGINHRIPSSPEQTSGGDDDLPAYNSMDETATSDTGYSTTTSRTIGKRKRVQGVALDISFSRRFVDTAPANDPFVKAVSQEYDSHSSESEDNNTTPQQKLATKFMSPSSSVPDYGSETSSESTNWNSPGCSTGESPSSPDLDSVMGFLDDADGGVALLPTCLAEELGLKDESHIATPTPASYLSHPQTFAGHLGAGLSRAFFTVPTGLDGMLANHAYVTTFNPSPAVGPSDTQVADNAVGQETEAETSSSPFSPQSKVDSNYPLAKEQPWKGFTCYEIAAKFSNDQLLPKYWTTKRGKERYVRHKIGDLKLDDAKLRSDRFSGSVARNPVHIFVDLSNIIIGFYDSMKESRGIPVNKRVMAPAFSFKNFDTILTRDRNVAKRVVAGSLANSYSKRRPEYMMQAQALKYEMNILERVPKPASPVRKRKPKAGARDLDAPTSGADTSGEDCFVGPMKHGEQGVDELLHLKILQSVIDTKPATMVLATGDAATAQYSDGFKKNIERVLAYGWNIELYGWSRNISSAWREPEFAEQWGHQFKIIELDGFCEELFDMAIESLEQ